MENKELYNENRLELETNEEYDNQEYIENENLNDELVDIEKFKAYPIISLDIKNVENLKYDKDQFELGLYNASYYCGLISAFKNIGLSNTDIMSFILNKENIDHNQLLQDKINENGLEVTKAQAEKIENQQL